MSCTFWIRRKKLAAQKQKEQIATAQAEQEKAEKPKKPKKPANKGGAKNDDRTG